MPDKQFKLLRLGRQLCFNAGDDEVGKLVVTVRGEMDIEWLLELAGAEWQAFVGRRQFA